MAIPTTRQGLIDYCLRNLGAPVIEINVSADQLEDRTDEALRFFQDYHFDGTEKVWLKHQVTGTTIQLTTSTASNFAPGEKITGQMSGVSFFNYQLNFPAPIPGPDILTTRKLGGTLIGGETLLGSVSGATAIVLGPADAPVVVIGDTENRYVPVSDAIIAVERVLPLNQNFSGSNFNMFDVRYQIMLNDMFSLTNINMLYYTQVQSHLSMIDFFINAEITYQFNRTQDRIFMNADWDQKINIGDWMVFECYAIVDPDTWTKVYNDRMLKKYLTALIKRQWGSNLSKFTGMVLPGGIQFDGVRILNEANAEVAQLENEIINANQLPVDFMIG